MNTIQMSAYTIRELDKHRNLMAILYSLAVLTIVAVVVLFVVGTFMALLIGTIMFILFCYFGNEEFHKWRRIQTGITGEDLFNACLAKAVDQNNTLYRNVPTFWGDIDYLLVGPGGVYAFEIKHHSGYINYDASGWKKVKISGGGIAYTDGIGNPSGQLGRNIMWLKDYLKSEGIDNIWIKGIVVFTHPRVRLNAKGLKNVMAITPEGIPKAVRGAEIGEEKAAKVIDALDNLNELKC